VSGDALAVEIVPELEAWSALGDWQTLFERAAAETIRQAGVTVSPGAELSVLLASDERVRALNAAWRGKDYATNVLSFPAVSPEALAHTPVLGDLALALETVRAEAERDEKSLTDHVGHLFVHGLLHLLGHDHEEADAAEAMETLEIRILAALGIPDPYEGTDLANAMAESS